MDKMEKIVSLAKRRGFVYPGSEIYGGLANTYDYGPLGTELLRNIQNLWWDKFVREREEIFGINTSILMNSKVWQASGHVEGFIEPLVECKSCHRRFKAETLKTSGSKKNKCPECGGELGKPKMFQGMFKTYVGATQDKGAEVYLRPETAQGMFVNFKNVLTTQRPKLPFGIAQIGKGFRNEVTLGNFIFRTLEFDMMEIEYFVEPKKWESYFEDWKKQMWKWLTNLGIDAKSLRWRAHSEKERAHYSKRTEDIEFEFPFGWAETYGLAYRTDYDLKNHSEKSGEDLKYYPDKGKPFYPHVVEPTFGANRTFLVLLLSAYKEEKERIVLQLPPRLAPYKAAVFPLLANKDKLVKKARGIFEDLKQAYSVAWDDRGNIGKRYFSQDEVGTPFCVTVDFDTLKDDTVTLRDRDSKKQDRVAVDKLEAYLQNKLES
jgi:glycyl-tRNA synthetase